MSPGKRDAGRGIVVEIAPGLVITGFYRAVVDSVHWLYRAHYGGRIHRHLSGKRDSRHHGNRSEK